MMIFLTFEFFKCQIMYSQNFGSRSLTITNESKLLSVVIFEQQNFYDSSVCDLAQKKTIFHTFLEN